MNQQQFSALGLMSGTSLDGLDIAWVTFTVLPNGYNWKINAVETIDYPNDWENKLRDAHTLTPGELTNLDAAYGGFLGEAINEFISNKEITQLDFIASHGHTVHHQPENRITVQIGNGPQIMRKTALPVVCDFRVQDVLLGGQGAPLVPVGDALLFAKMDACLNLGGFANISYEKEGKHIAFDICPANIVLNQLANQLGLDYDFNGEKARMGNLIPDLLEGLNALSYFNQKPPKSLGREWVDENVLPLINTKNEVQDVLHTYCEHIAMQIANSVKEINGNQILVSGGGAFNSYLNERMKAHTKVNFILPNNDIVTHKEALIFAFLGLLRWIGKANCLASVTGAVSDHSSGRIFRP